LVASMGLILSTNTVAVNTARAANPMDAEAKREALALWAKTHTRCGDSYFERIAANPLTRRPEYWATRNPVSFAVRAYTLHDAERANGVEWHGEISMTSSMQRISHSSSTPGTYEPGGRWAPWADGGTRIIQVLRKRANGGWEFLSSQSLSYVPIADAPVTAPDCSEIPN